MRRSYAISVIMAGATLAGLVLYADVRDREPVYAGKRLSVWLEGYGDGDYVAVTQQRGRDEANAAVRRMGTNAIPLLMRKLRAKDSALRLWAVAIAQKQRVFKISFTPAQTRRLQATEGMRALGADARKAPLTDLINLLKEPDWRVRVCACSILAQLGEEARDATTALVKALHDSNHVESAAVDALLTIDPEAVVPVLTNLLHEGDSGVRISACETLVKIGLDTSGTTGSLHETVKRAVPALVKAADDPDPTVRERAVWALRQIDPETARLGELR